MLKKFRVAVTTGYHPNYHSLLVGADGETFQIVTNTKPALYTEAEVVFSNSGIVLMQIIGIDYTTATKLLPVPPNIVAEIFNHKPEVQNAI